MTLLVVFFILPSGVVAQEHFYDFAFDDEGWVKVLPSASVEWESAFGNPAGSLRVDGGLSPCLQATTGGDDIWHIQADFFAEFTPGCHMDVYLYRDPACNSVSSLLPIFGPIMRIEGEWITLSLEHRLGLLFSGYDYFRILAIRNSATGACFVDNVQAIGPLPPPAPIPTLDEYSQTLLGLLLVCAAVVTLRRFRS